MVYNYFKCLQKWGHFYLKTNRKGNFRFISMVINADTTAIKFYPFIDFYDMEYVLVQVWHKNTKTKVELSTLFTKLDSQITVDLPNLEPINAVAKNLDTCLIRIFDSNVLIWEYLVTWSSVSTDINGNFKDWATTENIQPQWVTL